MKKLLLLLAIVAAINWSCSSPYGNNANDGSGTTGTATGAPPNSGGNPYPSTTSGMANTNMDASGSNR